MVSNQRYDAVILGGGLAGLTLSIQLKRARPESTVLVVEKASLPVPEAAHKVGESTSELACYYFAEVLGLKEHLEQAQLPKCALRFFMPAGDNSDIARRVEVGSRDFPEVDTFQLDRGRFENELAREARRLGVDLRDGCKVDEVSLDAAQGHIVRIEGSGNVETVQGRWLVDASGRAAILKRKLGLAKPTGHAVNAAWFRVADIVDIDTWSDEPEWHERVPRRLRRFSTNHLMAEGYWVWLIPLASGSHSIGIVADPAFHPFEQFNTFERAMEWLRRHEPQLATALDARHDLRQDFRVLKHFSFDTEQVYSKDRWCLTGEAGLFNDPLYSPGSDNISLSNTFVTDIITRDLDGEDVEERIEFFDTAFRESFELTLPIWEDKYPIFGNAQVFTAKHVFDAIAYWGFIALIFYHDKFADVEFLASVLPDIASMSDLLKRMQLFFLQWNERDKRQWQDIFIEGRGGTGIHFLADLLHDLVVDMSDEELGAKISENLTLIETVATEMFRKAAQVVAEVPQSQAINPYAISLEPDRWEDDGLFVDGEPSAKTALVSEELKRIWFDQVQSEQA